MLGGDLNRAVNFYGRHHLKEVANKFKGKMDDLSLNFFYFMSKTSLSDGLCVVGFGFLMQSQVCKMTLDL